MPPGTAAGKGAHASPAQRDPWGGPIGGGGCGGMSEDGKPKSQAELEQMIQGMIREHEKQAEADQFVNWNEEPKGGRPLLVPSKGGAGGSNAGSILPLAFMKQNQAGPRGGGTMPGQLQQPTNSGKGSDDGAASGQKRMLWGGGMPGAASEAGGSAADAAANPADFMARAEAMFKQRPSEAQTAAAGLEAGNELSMRALQQAAAGAAGMPGLPSPGGSDAALGGLGGLGLGGGAQPLTLEQQIQVQQAAAREQYSQFWVQQQLNAQMALFQNQQDVATSKLPEVLKDVPRPPKKGSTQARLPGDWTCARCEDHQFARNRTCRSCGAPRPHDS